VGAAPAGYVGEAAVLEATRLGLGTCWIGGGFRKRKTADLVELAPGERVYTVIALGSAPEDWTTGERVTAAAAGADRRMPLVEIAPSIETELWPAWALAGIELARLAPSARNRQPWRFRLEGEDVIVSYEGRETAYVSKRLDCGIAMLHFELAARAAGCDGVWEMLSSPNVARWRARAVEG
jgi:nitroreductase